MVAVMIVAGIAVVAFAIFIVWYLVGRGSEAGALWRGAFDEEYDGLVAKGEAEDRDREAAWRDFHAAQVKDETDRRTWEDPYDDGP